MELPFRLMLSDTIVDLFLLSSRVIGAILRVARPASLCLGFVETVSELLGLALSLRLTYRLRIVLVVAQ